MKYLLPTLLFVITLFSCSEPEYNNRYDASQISRIPYGERGTLVAGNYSGQGLVTNVAGTTVDVEGVVVVDAMSISGTVNVPLGSSLIVNDLTNVGGGGSLVVKGSIITNTFTQVGNTCVYLGSIKAAGKFTIGGGTTLYLSKSEIEASELVITGHIKATDPANTNSWYSVIDLKGSKYLNRGGGTNVCGPVVLNGDNDQGASGIALSDVTSTVIAADSLFKSRYGIDNASNLYRYTDNCTPSTTNHCN